MELIKSFRGCAAVKFLQPVVATIISTLRAPKSSEGYKSIGGGSPLRRITQEQADALAASLQAKGLNANVYVGMRYWKPFTEEAIAKVSRLYQCSSSPPFPLKMQCIQELLQEGRILQRLLSSWYRCSHPELQEACL